MWGTTWTWGGVGSQNRKRAPATTSTTPSAPTTGPCCRGNDTTRNTGRSGGRKAVARGLFRAQGHTGGRTVIPCLIPRQQRRHLHTAHAVSATGNLIRTVSLLMEAEGGPNVLTVYTYNETYSSTGVDITGSGGNVTQLSSGTWYAAPVRAPASPAHAVCVCVCTRCMRRIGRAHVVGCIGEWGFGPAVSESEVRTRNGMRAQRPQHQIEWSRGSDPQFRPALSPHVFHQSRCEKRKHFCASQRAPASPKSVPATGPAKGHVWVYHTGLCVCPICTPLMYSARSLRLVDTGGGGFRR